MCVCWCALLVDVANVLFAVNAILGCFASVPYVSHSVMESILMHARAS
jgi:hypothetical protein